VVDTVMGLLGAISCWQRTLVAIVAGDVARSRCLDGRRSQKPCRIEGANFVPVPVFGTHCSSDQFGL